MGTFDDLGTTQFSKRMRPHAEHIYKELFNAREILDIRGHILDKEFAIDTKIVLPEGQWITLQEKFITYDNFLKYGHLFTQEYKNAADTKYESPGEWFKLAAQLYFYGWANEAETGFVRWFILDVARYKLLVHQYGGLDKMGKLKVNRKWGRSSFYCIPISLLLSVIVYHSNPRIWRNKKGVRI